MYAHELNEIVTNQGLKSQMKPLFEEILKLRSEISQLRKGLEKSRAVNLNPDYLSPKEFGAEIGFRERTIQKWCAEGRVAGLQVCDGGSWRIPVTELDRIKRERGMTVETGVIYKIVD
jgi:hypothetical protein